MEKYISLICFTLLCWSCTNNGSIPKSDNSVKNRIKVYDSYKDKTQKISFYPNKDTVFFNPELKGFDSILVAVNCLNIYDENCWNKYDGEVIELYNRSKEPNNWADGPFSRYMPEKLSKYADVDPDAKRNNLDKLNVVRFQLFKDTNHFEQIFHLGVGIEAPSNHIVAIDYEDLEDMVGPRGNYGIGDGYRAKSKSLKKEVIVGANYMIHSNKNPEYKLSGMTRDFYEKPVVFSTYNKKGKLKVQQHVGNSLSCNGSAHYPVKGLQVKARSIYGENEMKAKIFDKKENYKNVRIRLGGSGQFSTPCQHVMDAVGHDIYGNRGLKNKFISLYMNGFQWGVGYLQEKLDEHYVEKYYGFDEQYVDVVEAIGISGGGLICHDSASTSKLDKRGMLDSLGYDQFLSYSKDYCYLASVKDGTGKAFSEFYEEALNGDFGRLNQESLFDYLVHVDFITSRDPGRSALFFCSDRRDAEWFVQAADFDHSFDEGPNANYWKVIFNPTDRDPFREILRGYFSKKNNRIAFVRYYQDALNTNYSLNAILPKIDKRIEEFALEVEAHEYAWTPNALDAKKWKNKCSRDKYLQWYATKRHYAATNHLVTQFMLETGFYPEDQKQIKIKFPKQDYGKDFYIELNSLKLTEDFEGKYYPWPSVKLKAVNLPVGYKLIGWKGFPVATDLKTSYFLEEDITLEPIIRKK